MIHIQELSDIIKNDIERETIQRQPESVDLLQSIGRILACDIQSPYNIPHFSVSAMDGYGTNIESDGLESGASLICVGESIAGRPFNGVVEAGQCIRIMTGAVVPDSVNTVIMQENVTLADDQQIKLNTSAVRGSHIRQRGEEVLCGDIVCAAGKIVSEADIPLLASLGFKDISVYPLLRIGIFSTGDELCELGDTLCDGQIFDSNRPTIKAILKSYPVVVKDYGIIKDDISVIKATLSKAAQENDFIVTSGGVSVGKYDFLKDAVTELGQIVQYKVAMKPGKPFVYGRIGRVRYFGLPGNPLSTYISAHLFLLPAIYHYYHNAPPKLMFTASLAHHVKRKVGRAELQRGYAVQSESGEWQVRMDTSQDSHRVHQLSQANVLVFIPAEQGDCSEGDTMTLFPIFDRFL